MNKKASTCALHNESSGVDELHHQRVSWEGMPVARTRIFHPFEYWTHQTATVEYADEDLSTDSSLKSPSKDGRLIQPIRMPGWLHDWAMRLFHPVRGP